MPVVGGLLRFRQVRQLMAVLAKLGSQSLSRLLPANPLPSASAGVVAAGASDNGASAGVDPAAGAVGLRTKILGQILNQCIKLILWKARTAIHH